MNLADPELEYIDPTPNVHALFIHFDAVFFETKLAAKAVVRWSKRMYSCAGVCSYEGRGGICDIALSEPLLKLRPRRDLVQTLLHEMIHAYLFVIRKDQSRDGHGPNFLAHMHRINKAAGLNITIYHDFHDEVHVYQTHWWRCTGPCQKQKPYFGIVRRTMNKPPGPLDYWWKNHMRKCGGNFIKIKEPEKPEKPAKPAKVAKKVQKPNADITKYINNNNNTINNKNIDNSKNTNIKGFKDITNEKEIGIPVNKIASPKTIRKPAVFAGSGQTVSGGNKPNSSVVETVRNIWANKTIPSVFSPGPKKIPARSSLTNINKHKISDEPSSSPPKKITKIDDYFKATATSLLKDIYGKDFKITQSSDTNKLKAVSPEETLVDCPICNVKVSEKLINTHIDECLNKDVIDKLSKETIIVPSTSHSTSDNRRETVAPIALPTIQPRQERDRKDYPKPSNTRHTKDFDNKPGIIKVDITEYNTKPPITNIDLTDDDATAIKLEDVPTKKVKEEPGTSLIINNTCPCCGNVIDKPVQEHLEECLMFFDNNTTIPDEGASTSFGDRTIVIDDSDDEFDETQTFNATGTKTPCPCCMNMVESAEMSDHLDLCLGIS